MRLLGGPSRRLLIYPASFWRAQVRVGSGQRGMRVPSGRRRLDGSCDSQNNVLCSNKLWCGPRPIRRAKHSDPAIVLFKLLILVLALRYPPDGDIDTSPVSFPPLVVQKYSEIVGYGCVKWIIEWLELV